MVLQRCIFTHVGRCVWTQRNESSYPKGTGKGTQPRGLHQNDWLAENEKGDITNCNDSSHNTNTHDQSQNQNIQARKKDREMEKAKHKEQKLWRNHVEFVKF